MTLDEMLVYFATAVAYAALAAAVLWALARQAQSKWAQSGWAQSGGAQSGGARSGWVGRAQPLRQVALPAFAGLVLVFLALHPFPDAATMTCPQPGTTPLLRPFRFLEHAAGLVARGVPLSDLIRDLTLVSSIMNFVVGAGFGLALARAGVSVPGATGLGLALSLGVETAQLTAVFGLYPCPYRQFDVDDLILNTSGTLAGAAAAALSGRRRHQPG